MEKIICRNCNQEKQHEAFGLCKSCYRKQDYWKNRDKALQQMKEYRKNHKKEIKKYNDGRKKEIKEYHKQHYHNATDGKMRIKIIHGNQYIQCRGGKNFHRVIAEKALGRRLKSYEVVHHVDGNTLNRDIIKMAEGKDELRFGEEEE